ncbi:MAG: LPS assembly lipoprotein LptE [Bacteroidia bacterium]|nr:LPS assembly lipoprotein LptE [Bacteroidia bacterium]
MSPNRFIQVGIVSLFFCQSCYTFTGASVSPDTKTVSVETFQNVSTNVIPTLSQRFSEALRDKIISQSTLTLKPTDGHIQFSGQITKYSIEPIAIQGSSAGQNRLTISVTVIFRDTQHPEKNWEQTFSQFADFSTSVNFSSVENQLIDEINEKLTTDIFNKSFANW